MTPRLTISRGYAAYALGLLTLINVINYLDRNVVFALFEPIKRELQLTDTQLGWLGSAYVLVFALAAVPMGILSDLKSRRAVIATGVTLWSAATALGGLARRYWQLFACRALVGFGEASYSPAAQALLADYFPARSRALALGIFSGGLALGGVAGIWLGGELESLYGWRAAFLALGIPGLVLAVLVSQLRDPARPATAWTVAGTLHQVELTADRVLRALWPLWVALLVAVLAAIGLDRTGVRDADLDAAVIGTGAAVGLAASIVRGVRIVIRQRKANRPTAAATTLDEFLGAAQLVLATPTLLWTFLGGAMIAFAMNGLVAWSPSFLHRQLGLTPQVVGRTVGLWGMIAGILGALFGGTMADRLASARPTGRAVTVATGLFVGTPFCIALLQVRDLELFIPLFFITIFFLTWYHGPLAALIFDVVPRRVAASVMGCFVFFSHIAGDAVAYPMIGFLSDRIGIAAAMLVLPAMALLGGGLFVLAARTVAVDMRREEPG